MAIRLIDKSPKSDQLPWTFHVSFIVIFIVLFIACHKWISTLIGVGIILLISLIISFLFFRSHPSNSMLVMKQWLRANTLDPKHEDDLSKLIPELKGLERAVKRIKYK